jgi:hypothetical protein
MIWTLAIVVNSSPATLKDEGYLILIRSDKVANFVRKLKKDESASDDKISLL